MVKNIRIRWLKSALKHNFYTSNPRIWKCAQQISVGHILEESFPSQPSKCNFRKIFKFRYLSIYENSQAATDPSYRITKWPNIKIQKK